jgi:predicted flap endonuclease-1-like 5' DNA nuclease
MSWYTAGEIVVWLLIAAVLGVLLGWLLRGILRPPRRSAPTAAAAQPPLVAEPGRTSVTEIDTGEGQTRTGSAPVESRFAPHDEASPPSDPVAPPADPVEARSRVAEIASRTAGDGDIPSDDLVRIHGVGPKIARLLVSMDITSFRQVARFTPEDVAVVNDALEVFPGRIERDDWMSSARELHREVYGTEP